MNRKRRPSLPQSLSTDRSASGPIDALERRTYFSPLSFAPPSLYPTGTHPDAIASADFTHDGNTDIVTADFSGNTVSVLTGNGNGTFQPPVSYPVGANPESIAVADLNGDGFPDIVTADTTSNTISVLLNTGNGTFAPAVQYAVGVRPEGVAVGDFNGDGSIDVVTVDEGSNTISVLNNSGTGTFGPATTYQVGNGPDAVAVGDVNGDERPDIVVAIPELNEVRVLLDTADGTFPSSQTYFTGDAPRAVLVTDLNSDGRPDIVTANLHAATISFLAGNGDGTFLTDVESGTGAFPFSVATGDLNGDGRTDIVTSNNFDNDASVLLRNGLGAFALQHGIRAGNSPVATIAVDVNGDGKDDLVSANFNSSQINVSLNRTVFVPLIPTTTTLTVGQNPVQYRNREVLTATIATTPGVPTVGVVQFFDGDFVLGVGRVNKDGVARISTKILAIGTSILRAHYGGNSVAADSSSATQAVTIVSAVDAVPFVTPSVTSVSLPTPFVAGDRGSAVVSIYDQGAGTARGTVGVNLTLVPNDPALPSIPVVTGATVGVALAGGQTKNARIGFTIPANVAPGGYTVWAALVPVAGLTTAQVDPAIAVSSTVFSTGLNFGTVGVHRSYTLTRALSNGSTITVSLAGGSGTMTDEGNGIVSLALSGTSGGSRLKVTSVGPIDIDGITDSAPMGFVSAGQMSGTTSFAVGVRQISAGAVNGATITLGNQLQSTLSFGAMTDVTLNSGAGIRSLSVAGWSGNSDDRLSAPWITTLRSAGDFGANVGIIGANHLTSIKTVAIAGAITNGLWGTAANIGKITVHGIGAGFSANIQGSLSSLVDGGDFDGDMAALSIGAFNVGGAVNNAIVSSGTNFGGDGLPGGGDDVFRAGSISTVSIGSAISSVIAAGLSPAVDQPFTVGGTLLPGGVIRSINVTGIADGTSKFVAARLPGRVKIAGTVQSPTGDVRFQI